MAGAAGFSGFPEVWWPEGEFNLSLKINERNRQNGKRNRQIWFFSTKFDERTIEEFCIPPLPRGQGGGKEEVNAVRAVFAVVKKTIHHPS